jgi:pimeloyl-ACP methyl ester carboxylesterase
VTSTIAPNRFLNELRGDTDTIPLGTWIGPLKEIYAADNTARLRQLKPPTLVLYGIQDNIISPSDEQTLINALTAAAANGGSF